ncbi:MAG TPA: peptide-methionine (S)-S-oxide reductase MsrA, partial [Thermopetrobacter sp.]|nr:peptide-methionine (S)-S-oxide reductase MsrA [Thermopetrobacter sp.]
MFARIDKTRMVTPDAALPGRPEPIPTADRHFVSGRPLKGPYPEDAETVYFGMGCYWGAERRFWQLPGVWVTAVGNIGGFTPNPTYEEVCSGKTGHAEAVMVVYRPDDIPFTELLKAFWEGHDPTQGMRQGNDIGTQYRSGIWCATEEQLRQAEESRAAYQRALRAAGMGDITTAI